MTLADVLHDAANDMRDYISPEQDGLDAYGRLAPQILSILAEMDELRVRLDNMGAEYNYLGRQQKRNRPDEPDRLLDKYLAKTDDELAAMTF